VRAGVVRHPAEWEWGGYREIQNPPQRYRLIDQSALLGLLGFKSWASLQVQHAAWVDEALRADRARREEAWSSSLAVGRPAFVAEVKAALGLRAAHRASAAVDDVTALREAAPAYAVDFDAENAPLSLGLAAFEEE
jgi:putative transposase